ncbi:MAG: MFS transporter [Actinobacteria bacterium]|nr:MFS transporter [Actinomycetota bacterium]
MKRLVMLLGFAGFIVMADNWVVSPLLPAISESVGVSAVSAGVLVTAYMLPFGIFQLLFGPLADRYGKTRVILITFTAFTAATTLCALGANLTSIAFFRALTGLFAAATMPVSFALIADIVPMEDRQHAIGSFMGVSTFGQALSMGIGGGIAHFFNWRGVFIVYGILSAIIAVALWRGLRSAVGDKEIRNPNAPLLKPYLSLLSNAPSRRTYIVMFVEGIFLLGSFSYFGAFLDQRFEISLFGIGVVMTAFGIAALIAGRISSKIAAKLGRTHTVLLGLVLAAIANGLVWVSGPSLILATTAVFVLGFGFMTAHSTLITIVTGFSAQARGATMSLAPFSFMLGGAIGTQIASRVITATSFSTMYALSGIGLLILALISSKAVSDSMQESAKA